MSPFFILPNSGELNDYSDKARIYKQLFRL
jgi:hypothetical protein